MKKFKNDKERIMFLEDYRNLDDGWKLWKNDDDLNRRWWKNHVAKGCSLVVEEQLLTFHWPQTHTQWSIINWYIIDDWSRFFGDCRASRTQALAKLKELQKEGALL